MARAKVAAALRALMADLRAKVRPGKAGAGDAQVIRMAEGELRYLLAVARAAERVVGPKHAEDIIPRRPWDSLSRALARLRRSGGAGRAGR